MITGLGMVGTPSWTSFSIGLGLENLKASSPSLCLKYGYQISVQEQEIDSYVLSYEKVQETLNPLNLVETKSAMMGGRLLVPHI